MGIYINKTSTGEPLPYKGKLAVLLADGAKVTHPAFQPNLLCCIENPGSFDAVMYCETEQDFDRTIDERDVRLKTYIIHPDAAKICDKL